MATSYRERALNSINKQTKTNDVKSNISSYRQRALNSNNKINQPTQTVTEKMDSLWVESTAPNALQKQNINATVKPLNISNFVNDIEKQQTKPNMNVDVNPINVSDFVTEIKTPKPKQNINIAVKPIDINNYAIPKTELNRIGQEIKAEKERWDNLPIQDKIAEPFRNIGANFTHGDLSIKENMAWNEYRAKQDEATLKKAQEATKAREDFEATNDRIGKGNALTKEFAQYLPQLGGQLKSGLGGAVAGAGAGALGGAGVALVAGQLGPQVALPEEIATVPAGVVTGGIWGGRGGYVAGTAKYSYDMMAGSAYKSLLDMGVPNEVALELSGDEALINSLIEGGGAIVDLITLGVGKLATKGGTTAAKEVAKNRLLAAAKAYGLNLVSEPLEEMAQEKVSIETEKKAANMTGIERNATEEEDWERIKGAGETAIKVSAVSGGLNAGGNYIANNITKNINDNRQTQAQINQDLQNLRKQNPQNVNSTIQRENVTGLPKLNAQNQAQNSSIEQTNVTLPTRAETAQNANMEQIRKNTNLITQRAENNRLSNQYFANNKVIYNNDGTVNRIKTGENIFENNEGKSIAKTIKDYLEKHINEYASIIESGQRVYLGEDLPGEYSHSKSTQHLSSGNMLAKGRAAVGLKEIIENASNRNWTKNLKEKHNIDAKYGFYKYDTTFSFDYKGKEKVYTGSILIRNDANGKKYLYDILDIKPKKIDNDLPSVASNSKSSAIIDGSNSSSINSIPQSENTVNTEYAQSTQNDTSTYISPVSDIQGATEFVKKATIKDVDRLREMLEEAEQSPDRIDLQFFAEEARAKLEKLSREQIENMLEEGIKQNRISYSDSIYRNLRRALGEKGYKYVKENVLDKLDAAKLDNVNMKIEIANELKSYVVDGLGIKKGSKESELVQKYGEKEITLDELKEATPNWENVVKADDWFRSKYDELIDRINESRAEIYPYIEEKIEATELELKVVKQQIKDIEENGTPNFKKDAEIRTQIENIQNRIDSKTKALEEAKNKNTLKYKNNLRIKNEAEQRLGELNDLLEIRTENKLYKLTEKAEKLQNILDSEELWRGKRIPKRKDYYRHFQEMTEGFEALGNILSTPSEISNNLSGISENTKPSSKWLGLAQRRLTNKTKYDAVGGFLNYLDSASYAINIDPEIKRIRDFTEEIRNASEDNTANRLIEYLTDYANDLAGKTNPMDRYIQKVIPGGRKTMKAISWVTNRIKSNAVLGNFNSAAAQILNIPQGLADIKNPKNIAIGFWETLTGDKDGKYKNSQFITERFNSDVYSQFNERLIDQPKKLATWLLGALDEFGTKTIWNGEYSKAVDIGIKDPVRYADYRTRDLVAGRGIGELSLNQRSKTIGLLAPFTVEVSNYWGVVKDFISAKDFGGIVLLQVFAFLFNKGLEELGVSAGVFDLIDALIDAWNTEGGIDKKAGRVAGEFLSNTMFGQQIAGLYPENGADLGFYQLPTRSELFGDADPTRMGTGSVLSKAISNPVTSVVLPWGGTQLNKTTQGLKTFAEGGAYSKDAEGNKKLKYPVEQNLENFAKSALFGKWSTEGAKQYIDSGFKALSANQTEGYEKAKKAGISDKYFYDAYNAQKKVEGLGDLTSLVKKNEIDKVTKGLSAEKRKILYETFNVSKSEWGNSKIVYPYEIKAQKEKMAREKLKTKKK